MNILGFSGSQLFYEYFGFATCEMQSTRYPVQDLALAAPQQHDKAPTAMHEIMMVRFFLHCGCKHGNIDDRYGFAWKSSASKFYC